MAQTEVLAGDSEYQASKGDKKYIECKPLFPRKFLYEANLYNFLFDFVFLKLQMRKYNQEIVVTKQDKTQNPTLGKSFNKYLLINH